MLSNTIKQLAQQAIEAGAPMAVMFGTVTTADPLAVLVDNRFQITGAAIIVPRGLVLENNDKVILLRNAGGQQFIVMGVMP